MDLNLCAHFSMLASQLLSQRKSDLTGDISHLHVLLAAGVRSILSACWAVDAMDVQDTDGLQHGVAGEFDVKLGRQLEEAQTVSGRAVLDLAREIQETVLEIRQRPRMNAGDWALSGFWGGPVLVMERSGRSGGKDSGTKSK